ncbi:MAG TPA: N,N-dimethylformamidase beta subunit family domain-containing protein [Myxococcaceae bacterium]|nr:N,N-dimethylformamidase beta subunit family domain-containing protein [Myxococcaceae bacterium]
MRHGCSLASLFLALACGSGLPPPGVSVDAGSLGTGGVPASDGGASDGGASDGGLGGGDGHPSGPDGGAGDGGTSDAGPPPHVNPVVEENRRPGDPGWREGPSTPAGDLGLYASTESAHAGDVVEVHAFSKTQTRGLVEVFRLGDYGGAGARRVWASDSVQLGPQPACPRQPATALVECDWATTVSFSVKEAWVSGVYVIRVRRDDGARSFTPFVVRDGRSAELLLQTTFSTDQAYNGWGGESLYEDGSGTMPNRRATQVSFNRPYLDFDGLGRLASQVLHFLQFVERAGYDVTYATNLDYLREPHLLDHVGALVIAGHDEYWPREQRAQVDAALASGTSLAYFGANGGYWRIRLESDAHGRALRTITCFKQTQGDPQPGSTVRYRDPPDPHPENAIFGIMYGSYLTLPFPLVVADPGSWIFAGTGLHAGDRLLDLVGTEFDSLHDNGMAPSGLSFPAVSPVLTAEGRPGVARITTRELPGGGIVFAAGSIDWARGLSSDPSVRDPRLERMTRNVLERALARVRPPAPLPTVSGGGPTEPAPDGAWAKRVEALAGTPGARGGDDGPGAAARFDGPSGLAVTPDGSVVVAEAWGNRIRLIGRDEPHLVTTVAGSAEPGSYDGAGTSATFRSPLGVAVDSAGAIYVADSDNHRIRRIDPGKTHQVSTLCGGAEGFADGPLVSARFSRPTALALAPDGALIVADQMNARIRRIDLVHRVVTTLAGNSHWGFADAADGVQARFQYPSALAVATSGDVFVIDAGNAVIRRIDAKAPHAVSTLAGMPGRFGFADGAGDSVRFRAQLGAAVTADGRLLVGDAGNSRVRTLEPARGAGPTRVKTIAGSGRVGNALGDAASSDLVTPTGLAVLPDGSVVVSDPWNQVVRRVVP